MTKNILFVFVFVVFLFLSQCKVIDETNNMHETGTITDFEGNIYATIKIGNQWWMAENFKATHAADGTQLNGVYAYDDDENNIFEYGRLYNYNAALNGAPTGWRLPSRQEWDILIANFGNNAGAELKEGGNSGFEGVLGGVRHYEGGYSSLNVAGLFWSSTPNSSDHNYILNLFAGEDEAVISGFGIIGAISVRYIRD